MRSFSPIQIYINNKMLSNTNQKYYAEQIQQQSLSRIRKRISHLSSTNEIPSPDSNTNSKSNTITNVNIKNNSSQTNSPEQSQLKQKSTGFSSRLEQLHQSCQQLMSNITDLNAEKRGVVTRINMLKQALLRNMQAHENQNIAGLKALSNRVQQQVIVDSGRYKQIQQNYYKSVQQNNDMKVILADLRNKINQIEHRLGFHATIWQKL